MNLAMNRIDIVLVLTVLFKALLEARTRCFSQETMCHGTEICLLRPNASIQVNCNCSGANSHCSWISQSSKLDDNFLSRGNTGESLLLEWTSTIGYGNFICIRDDSTVVKSILILPVGKYDRLSIDIKYVYVSSYTSRASLLFKVYYIY